MKGQSLPLIKAIEGHSSRRTDGALLRCLFPWHAPVDDDDGDADAERPSLLARAAQGPRELPKEVFWLVFKFWRSCRDSSW